MRFRLLSICLAILLLLSCRPKKEEPIRLGLNIWPGYGAFFIAKDKKFFEAAGVSVELEVIQGDPERESALAAGKIHAIGMTIDNLAILRAKGIPIKAIFKYDQSSGADGIVVKNEITSIAGLEGKRVAWASGTPSHFFLIRALAKNELTPSELRHVPMSSDEAGAAFAAGHLDAAVTWEPWLSKAQEGGMGRVLISTRELPVIDDVLFVREEVIGERREDLVKMLRACFRAIDYWKENPSEGNQIIATNLGIPLPEVEAMLGGIQIMDRRSNREFFGSRQSPGPAFEAYRTAVESWSGQGVAGNFSDSPEAALDPSIVNDAS